MSRSVQKGKVLFLALFALALQARGALTDYAREELTDRMGEGWPESAQVFHWYKIDGGDDSHFKTGQAWAVRFDLSSHRPDSRRYRFTTRYGLTNIAATNINRRATLQEMADKFTEEGRTPLVAINGSYFSGNKPVAEIDLYSGLMSDGRVLCSGGGLLTGTGDQQIKMDGVRLQSGGQWPRNSDYGRIFNEHGFYSTPNPRYSDGEYHPPENPEQGDLAKDYAHSLVGTGINHEYGGTYLVFFVSDGRQDDWSYGVEDRDAIDMMVSIGCETVGENDGGGSAGLWISNLPAELAPRDANYINKSCDGHPRAVAEGVFMMYEEPFESRVLLLGFFGGQTTIDDFDCLDNALRVADSDDYVELEPLFGREGIPVELRWPATNTVPITLECQQGAASAPVMLCEGASLAIGASSKFEEVMFENADGSPATVEVLAGKTLTVGWDVTNVNYRTWSDSGLCLAAPLTGPTVVDCQRLGENATFAKVAVTSWYDEDAVFDDLQKFVHPTDPDMVAATFEDADTLRLRWLPVAVIVNGKGRYGTLDDAFRAARKLESPILEIVRPVTLSKSFQVDFDCTIRTRTGDAAASAVLLDRDVALSVGGDARVLVENVLMTNAANAVTTEVLPGATLAVSGTVGLGIVKTLLDDSDMTGNPQMGQLEVAGALAQPILLKSCAGSDIGNAVASSSLTLAETQVAAPKLVNVDDDELAGEAYVDTDGSVGIRWGAAEVSDEDARVRFISEDGAVTNNYRSLRLLFRMLADSGRIELLADCPLVEPATIPAGKSVVMFSAGEDPFVVALPASDTWKTNALVSVCGSISVTNVVFDGSEMPPGGGSLSLFRILSGASVELGAAAGIRDVTLVPQSGDNKKVQGVVYVLRGGEFQMDDGSFVTDCSGGSGAAVYLSQSGAAARLMGGHIEGCVHPNGAVYAALGATIEVAGDVNVKDNRNDYNACNICPKSADDLKLVGVLTGRVGVNFGNADDAQFGVVTGGGDSADHFVCDTKTAKGETLLGSASNGTLVWKATVVVPPPNVEVNGKTYGTLEDAVAAAAAGDTLTILAPIAVSSMPVRIDRALTITASDPTNVIRRGASGELSVNTVARAIEIASTGVVFRNIVLGDDDREWPRAFVHVLEGGELTLGEGAVVRNVRATAMMREGRMEPIGRSAAGVLVAGTLIMEDGSAIVSCVNRFDQSAGGGVLASGSGATFDFRGGTVSGCSASRGGGVCIEKHAKALVRGGGTILDNANGNLYVAAESPLEIADVFTGRIDYREGVVRPDTETNIFADVTYDYADDLDALAAGAIRFTNELTRACGVAVTNAAGEASYIWNTALATSTTYEKDDNRWAPIGEVPPQPVPQVTTEVDPPTAVPGLVYNAQVQKGVLAADGYTVTGGEAVNAGDYTAVVALRPNYVWRGGTTDSLEVPWSIAKATYDMSGVVFTNVTYVYDGSVKSNLVDTATLPDGVRVTGYENNGQTEIGDHTVTAHFAGDEVNHNSIPDMTAKLTIVAEPTPPGPTPGPHWEVVTNHPTKIAFRSIDRVSDTEWALVVTNRVRYCNYRLIWTTDLTQGFTTTGDWEHVVHEGCAVWATNVTTTGGAWFWRAEGADGTNMVLKAEE